MLLERRLEAGPHTEREELAVVRRSIFSNFDNLDAARTKPHRPCRERSLVGHRQQRAVRVGRQVARRRLAGRVQHREREDVARDILADNHVMNEHLLALGRLFSLSQLEAGRALRRDAVVGCPSRTIVRLLGLGVKGLSASPTYSPPART